MNTPDLSNLLTEPAADSWHATCDAYLGERTGRYEYRAIRYRKAADWLVLNGLDDSHTLVDIGAGWTEFDYCLRREYNWRGRYIPIDGGIGGEDLNEWVPVRDVDWFVALEILEHLQNPSRLVSLLQGTTKKGGVVSVPDPERVDVFGMDETHLIEVTQPMLQSWGFRTSSEQLYGGVFSHDGGNDALMGFWTP